jgi:hypothetical protein
MAWAKLISFLNGLISKISQNKPVKPVKFFSSFPDANSGNHVLYSTGSTKVLRHVRVGANGLDQRSASRTSKMVGTGDWSSLAGSSYAKYCCMPRLILITDIVATLHNNIVLIYISYTTHIAHIAQPMLHSVFRYIST